jgi:hypothetical protein
MADNDIDFTKLMAMAGAHAEARAIQVALKLGVFEALVSAQDTGGLARAIGGNERAAMLLANALVAMGLLEKREGIYALAQIARRFLLKSSDDYLGGMILFDGALFGLWERLEGAIRTGRPVRTPDMYQQNSEETERFIRAMDTLVRARGDARYVASTLELGEIEVVADIGGGPGTYVIELLRRWPALRALIYDLPVTLAVTEKIVSERAPELRSRLKLVEFDYRRNSLEDKADLIFLSNIIHGEDGPTNQMLMHKIFTGLRSPGTVIIKDHIMNESLTEPAAGAVFSLFMLLTTVGRDYSMGEVSGWLVNASFIDIEQRPLPSPPFTSSLVVARKP